MVSPTGIALTVMFVVAGMIVVAAGVRGMLPRGSAARVGASEFDHLAARVVLAVGGFAVVLLLTGWIVAALYGAASGFLFPTLVVSKRRRREAVERIDAIAAWVESLRDTMAASAGIQEALQSSAKVAPRPIRSEVQALALRLQHEPLGSSLRRFAADMHHPLTDMIVASLVLATARHAGSLQGILAMTAKAARDYAAMWRHIESGRARLYAQSRLAGWVSFIMIFGFILARREFLAPFDGVGGQVALLVIGGAFFGSAVSLYRLTRPVDPNRPFQTIEFWSPATIEVEPRRSW